MGYLDKISHILLIALIISLIIPVASAAIVRGVIYDHNYNPLQKIVVTINTTPEQVKISTTGAYYFNVPSGSYSIIATLTKNNITKEIASQEVTVAESDDIVKDLLLYDDFDLEAEFLENWWTKTQDFIQERIEIFVILTLTIVVVICVMYGLSIYRKKILNNASENFNNAQSSVASTVPDGLLTEMSSTESEVSDVNIELIHSAEEKPSNPETAVVIASPQPIIENKSNDDLMKEKISKLIAQTNGTLTQKDLRKEFSVSEAKISMVLSSMEADGAIKKVKKGRVNYLQLVGVVKNS